MSTATEHRITTGQGAELYARVEGEGPTIFFIAGLGDDTESWSQQVEGLKSDYRCITFDNRGIGRSSVPDGFYNTRDLADEAHEVLEALGGAPAVVVGSSTGGQFAQQLALRHPGDISLLILTNTWGEQDFFIRHATRHWIDLAQQGLTKQLIDELLLWGHAPDFMRAHPEAVEAHLSMEIPDARGFIGMADAAGESGQLEELPNISAPTLVIAGEQDIICRPSLSVRIAEAIPSAELRYIDAGHMIFWEKPEEWEAVVREFLDRHADRIGS